MKNTFEKYTQEGLRIIDENGVNAENPFENDLIYQEMEELGVENPLALSKAKAEIEKKEYEYEVFKIFDPFYKYSGDLA